MNAGGRALCQTRYPGVAGLFVGAGIPALLMSLKDAWARVPAWHRCAAERNLMPERKLVLW